MEKLLDTINKTREEIITKHYRAAVAELKEKIAEEPLKTKFHIHSGCVSKQIAEEIAFRLMKEGMKEVKIIQTGILLSTYVLSVKINLPENLIHIEPNEDSKSE